MNNPRCVLKSRAEWNLLQERNMMALISFNCHQDTETDSPGWLSPRPFSVEIAKRDGLHLGVLLDAVLGPLPPNARLLDAAEGALAAAHHAVVDSHHAGLDPLRDPETLEAAAAHFNENQKLVEKSTATAFTSTS